MTVDVVYRGKRIKRDEDITYPAEEVSYEYHENPLSPTFPRSFIQALERVGLFFGIQDRQLARFLQHGFGRRCVVDLDIFLKFSRRAFWRCRRWLCTHYRSNLGGGVSAPLSKGWPDFSSFVSAAYFLSRLRR